MSAALQPRIGVGCATLTGAAAAYLVLWFSHLGHTEVSISFTKAATLWMGFAMMGAVLAVGVAILLEIGLRLWELLRG